MSKECTVRTHCTVLHYVSFDVPSMHVSMYRTVDAREISVNPPEEIV